MTFVATPRAHLRLVVAAVGVALVVAGCGDDEPSGSGLPSYSPSPSVSATQGGGRAEEAAVEKAYRGYLRALEKMAASGDMDPATLRPYATAESAQQDVEALALLFDDNLRQVGPMGVDVRSVEVKGRQAVLTACLDLTKVVTVKKGQTPDPGVTGLPPGLARVELVRQDGRWLVETSKDAGAC